MMYPIIYNGTIPDPTSPNAFGAIRKHDVHTGVDLFCPEGSFVYAIESGTVIGVFQFTGVDVGMPWWNDTYGVLVSGKSGNFLYGEIQPEVGLGDTVLEGDIIGSVMKVLKTDKGKPMSMLHLELYEKEYMGRGVTWNLGEPKPDLLLDPTDILKAALKMPIKHSFEYRLIKNFYGHRTAERSGVPLINHINEGLKILQDIGASDNAAKAYCLHPIVQCDEDLMNIMNDPFVWENLESANTLITAMEYRSVANAYLSEHYKGFDDKIKLSCLKDVNDMLIADKIQNRKDFMKYHYGTHPKSDILSSYFINWLRVLGISEEKYKELSSAL